MRKLLFGTVLLILAIWIGFGFLPNDQSRIRKLLDQLAAAACFAPNQGGFAKLAYANRLADFFTPDASLHLEAIGGDMPVINSRSDLVEAALAARSQLRSAEFQVSDFGVKFPGPKGTANAYALISGRINGQTNRFGQPFKMSLIKTNGHWLISSLHAVPGVQ